MSLYDTPVPPPIFGENDKLTDPAAKKARELHTAIKDAAQAVRDVEDRHREAVHTLQGANAELTGRLRSGELSDEEELELADGLRLARLKADPQAHQVRLAGAKERLERAAEAYNHHCAKHFGALYEAIRPQAEAAAKELAEAQAALQPLIDRYHEAARVSGALVSSLQPPRRLTMDEAQQWAAAWAIPRDGSVPLPSEEAVATWVAGHPAPAPEPLDE